MGDLHMRKLGKSSYLSVLGINEPALENDGFSLIKLLLQIVTAKRKTEKKDEQSEKKLLLSNY